MAITITFLVVAIILLILLTGTIYTTQQQTVRFIERFGRYVRTAKAGINVKIPIIEQKSDPFNLQVQELIIDTETKTKDNVFVLINIAVQYEPIHDRASDAYYKLNNPKSQIVNWVNDSVRSNIPDMSLDDIFLNKNTIAGNIEKTVRESIKEYGYNIVRILLTDIRPDKKVQEAMNEINASQRLREAATNKAEAEKIIIIKNAEAERDSKILSGEGVAGQREAIIKGLRNAISDMSKATKLPEKEVMEYVQFTQYTDVLKDIGSKGTTLIMPMTSNELLKNLLASKKL